MKLIIAIIRDTDDGIVINRLVEKSYRVTRVASTGGFLRRGNVTLLIGAEANQVDEVISLLREVCSPAEAGHGRATIFVVDAQDFVQV
jgi:uncharacterized protein YaaQ